MNVERFDPTKVFTPEEMAVLRRRSDATGLLCVAHCWIVIFAMMALFALWPNPLTFVAAVIVIGTRQLGLGILNHDAAHGVLTRTKWLNEWVGQWLCAYPGLGNMIAYRHYHLEHHRKTQQPDDPDLVLSAPFPITRASYRRKFVRDITGQTGIKLKSAQIRRAFAGATLRERLQTFRNRLGPQTIVQLILLAGLIAAGKWYYYLIFWVLPDITWQQVVTRIRNIAEHAVVPDNNDVFRNARTTYANWLERMLIAPYWVNYHVDHHLLFYVPCYNLPRLHRMLLAKGLGPKMEIQPDYLTMMKLAVSKPEPSAPMAVAA
jgi:fatty acid desaturase